MRTVGPAEAFALLVGVGLGASAFLVVAALGGILLGYRLWPVEAAVGLAAAGLGYLLFWRVREAQSRGVREDRARRAIQRLSYRRGPTLSVALVARETLLDEAAARAAVGAMREEGIVEGPDDAFRVRA